MMQGLSKAQRRNLARSRKRAAKCTIDVSAPIQGKSLMLQDRNLLNHWIEKPEVETKENIKIISPDKSEVPWGIKPKIKVRPEMPREHKFVKPKEPSSYTRCAFCFKKGVRTNTIEGARQFHFHRSCVRNRLETELVPRLFNGCSSRPDYLSYYKRDRNTIADFKTLDILPDQDAIDGKWYCPRRKDYHQEVYIEIEPLFEALLKMWPDEFCHKNVLALTGGKWLNQEISADKELLYKYYNFIEDLYQNKSCYRFERHSPRPFECFCKFCFSSGLVEKHVGHKTKVCGCQELFCKCHDKVLIKYYDDLEKQGFVLKDFEHLIRAKSAQRERF